jgi:hypothetical protein
MKLNLLKFLFEISKYLKVTILHLLKVINISGKKRKTRNFLFD